MNEKNFHALTTKFSGKANSLPCKIKLSVPFNPEANKDKHPPSLMECNALWDTGATCSVITKGLAKKIGLKPTGKTEVYNPSGVEIRNTYLVNIYLPNRVVLSYVRIVECEKLKGDIDFLIGMDVIGAGDFSVTNVDNRTTLSYRIPSIKTIDYVEVAEAVKKSRVRMHKLREQARLRRPRLPKRVLKKKRKKERQRRKKARKKK